METATLSSKGQLVIPRQVRALAHLVAGDEFTVNYVQGEIRLRPLNRANAAAIDDVAGCMVKFSHTPMTDKEAEKIAKARLMAEDMMTLTKPKTIRKLPRVRTK
jgi:AbrB family looped-hinge helix DNA binding protein